MNTWLEILKVLIPNVCGICMGIAFSLNTHFIARSALTFIIAISEHISLECHPSIYRHPLYKANYEFPQRWRYKGEGLYITDIQIFLIINFNTVDLCSAALWNWLEDSYLYEGLSCGSRYLSLWETLVAEGTYFRMYVYVYYDVIRVLIVFKKMNVLWFMP